jgi:OOP family OmpA-OmpF porin
LKEILMHDHLVRRWLVLACVALIAGVGCGGCGGLTKVAATQACGWTSPAAAASDPGPADAQSSTVVLIDISASYWPRKDGAESLPDGPQQAALDALVSGFAEGGTRLVSLGTFDGSSATVRWQLADVALPSAIGTTQLIQDEQQRARGCLHKLVDSAMTAAPQVPGTDAMAALGAAGTELGATQAIRSHVLVITDGLSNTGCLNLNKVLGQGESASDVVSSCQQQNGLSRLRGAQVQLAGIGFQALRRPMSTIQQGWLENYWRDLCVALKVQSPQSCVQPQTTDGARKSNVTRLSDPAITFPTVGRERKVVIPAPLLFAFNSAALTRTAGSYLEILIQEIRDSRRPIIRVIGHTDSVGSASYNVALSLRRARAVRAYLAVRGFPGITATGVGFTQPACPHEYTPSGQPDKACMARDRRVEIILGG